MKRATLVVVATTLALSSLVGCKSVDRIKKNGTHWDKPPTSGIITERAGKGLVNKGPSLYLKDDKDPAHGGWIYVSDEVYKKCKLGAHYPDCGK